MLKIKGRENNISYLLREDNLRRTFKFIARKVRLHVDGDNDTYPVIMFIHTESAIPAAYTGFERYINDYNKAKKYKGTTLYKKANSVCIFLNYILWNTSINEIHECTLKNIRDFLVYLKSEHEGYDDPEEFYKVRACVFDFLCRYYDNNNMIYAFGFSSRDLKEERFVKDVRSGRLKVVASYNDLSIKAPHKHRRKKNRVLFMEASDLIQYAAKKYDPLLVLPIALQLYAGIREGEIANVTCGGITIKYGPYKAVTDIEIYLEEEQKAIKDWEGLTEPGSIKTYVDAKVYPKFLNTVIKLYDEHIAMLENLGYDTSPDQPLFRNTWGKPMTAPAYSARVKKLFYDCFLPLFKAQCEIDGTLAENLAYIEAYENDYPGAHMFRHWFTNYLTIVEELDEVERKEWRRDSSLFSQEDYLHVTPEIRREYLSCKYVFQRHILDEITKLQDFQRL